jgi:hypothetical protein
MTHEEQLVADALNTMGIPFSFLPWSDAPRCDVPCSICGKPRADFALYRNASGDRAFHIECLPSMRRPKMTMPFAFEYLRNVEVERMVEEKAAEEAKERERQVRKDLREAINKVLRAIG